MPNFIYKAKNGPNEWVEGSIEAVDRDQAVRRIADLGYVPVQVHLEAAKAAAPHAPSAGPVSRVGRVRSQDISLLTRQLASMLRAQVPVLQALSVLADQQTHAGMRKVVASIHADVKEGKPMSAALQRFPSQFPPTYLSMIRSGEMSGRIEEVLDRLALLRDKEREVELKVRGALAYPIFLLVVGLFTVMLLLTFVLPRLLSTFKDMGLTLPLATRVVLAVSGFLSKAWPFLVMGGALVFALVSSQPAIRRRLKSAADRLALAVPVVRPLVLAADLERFCRTLALLLKSGVAIVQAVEAAVNSLENEALQGELKPVGPAMLQGSALSKELARVRRFPPMVRNMVAVGEEGGRLEEILEELAGSYAIEVEANSKLMTSLLEPVLILALGLVVGFIVAAMLLPIFQMNLAAG